MSNNEEVSNTTHLLHVLSLVKFGPSCVNFNWKWEVEEVYSKDESKEFCLRGWLVNTTFQRPDTETGEMGLGRGRKEFIDLHANESSVVKTCWLLAELIVRHELMESFHVMMEGEPVKVFNPHHTIEELSMPHSFKNGTLKQKVTIALAAMGVEVDDYDETIDRCVNAIEEDLRTDEGDAPYWEEAGAKFDPRYHERMSKDHESYGGDVFNILVKPMWKGTTFYDDATRAECPGCKGLFPMLDQECDYCDNCHKEHAEADGTCNYEADEE